MNNRQQLIDDLRFMHKGNACVQRAATEIETLDAQITEIFKKLYSKRATNGEFMYIEKSDLLEVATEYGIILE